MHGEIDEETEVLDWKRHREICKETAQTPAQRLLFWKKPCVESPAKELESPIFKMLLKKIEFFFPGIWVVMWLESKVCIAHFSIKTWGDRNQWKEIYLFKGKQKTLPEIFLPQISFSGVEVRGLKVLRTFIGHKGYNEIRDGKSPWWTRIIFLSRAQTFSSSLEVHQTWNLTSVRAAYVFSFQINTLLFYKSIHVSWGEGRYYRGSL
jgi:hypothetical protein